MTYMDGKPGAEDLMAKVMADPALMQSLAAQAAPSDDDGSEDKE